MTGMGGGGRPEEIVNNYYGDDAGARGERGDNFADDDRSRENDDPGNNVFTDSGDADNFTGNDEDGDDDSSLDDGNDSNSDDSSFDDGGDSSADDSSSGDSY